MNNRFQIEDLRGQDASGVIFRALDTETGKPVAIRRFFPFGADGGGLNAEEQAAYDSAVARLAEITHPALRSIVCGGCDPVDGMPFIATEWITGNSLLDTIAQTPLTVPRAAAIITKALQVCEMLSETLGSEAVWIQTDLKSIVVGDEESGRDITFWMSPLKWLGRNETQRGLDAIIKLVTGMMGWRGKASNELPHGNFTNGLNWLRGSADTITLHEARERLTAAMTADSAPAPQASTAPHGPPTATRATVKPPVRTAKVVVKKKKKSRLPALLISSLLLIALAGGGWALVRWHEKSLDKISTAKLDLPEIISKATTESPATPGVTAALTEKDHDSDIVADRETSGEEASRRALELSAEASRSSAAKQAEAAYVNGEISKRGGVFTPADHELLIAQDGKMVALEGVFQKISFSKTHKTMYLLFSSSPNATEPRGGISISKAPADLTEAALAPLVGKKIRLRGTVDVDKVGKGRPVIMIGNRKAIEFVE